MSRLRNLKSAVLIWLMILAIGLAPFGCNSANHSAKQIIHKERANVGGAAGTQRKPTTATIPAATGNMIAKHREEKSAGGFGGAANGLGKALEATAKISLAVAVVGGVVIGSLFLDHQVWRLQDKMF